MAKRKGSEGQIKRLLKILPTALLVMIICVGVLLGVLIETGRLSLSDVQQTMGFASRESTAAGNTIPEAARAFAVHVIDVGQGDSILITAGDKSILIDAGEKEYGSRVVSFIRDKGIERLDYIIATHPHADHIGGMAEVVEEIGADRIIVPKLPDDMVPTTRVYENFLKAVKNGGMKLTAAKAGTVYDISDIDGIPVRMTVLAPDDNADFDDLNDFSVCVRIDFDRVSWLLTGDLSENGEAALVNSGRDIDVTAYKVGHHGSATASTDKFLKKVTPRLCVISCGEGNSYGHPTQAALDRLLEYTSSIYRTDLNSTVSVYSDGQRLYVTKTEQGVG